MSVSVLVVDDSPIARKMLVKSLPSRWDATIMQAGNGVEALAAYRAGRVDVMFLDLTMPEMDGYQVLQALRKEGLNCLVIVVSADVQHDARERVLSLGAIDFLIKPVDGPVIESLLRRYGIEMGAPGHAAKPSLLTQEQKEILQEVVNIGMGQAGACIAGVLGEFVELSIPRIFILSPGEVSGMLASVVGSTRVSAVRQAFQGRLRGEAIVIYSDQRCNDLAELMGYERDLDRLIETELLLDVSNILVGACLGGIAGQLRENMGFTAPSLVAEDIPIGDLLPVKDMPWNTALLIDVAFRLEKRSFACNLVIFMPECRINALVTALDSFMEAY